MTGGHGFEHQGHGLEHESESAGEPGADEHDDRGHDHESGQEGHACVHQTDGVGGLLDVHVLPHVGSVCDHDTHGEGQGVEQLAHRTEDGLH